MNCVNCGAPMKLVRGKDYFYCEYCTSYYFPELVDDMVRVLEEPGDVNCPVCQAELVRASIEGQDVLYCTRCRGLLVQQPVFYLLVGQLRRRSAGSLVRLPPVDPDDLKRRLQCPRCHQEMDTHPYFGPGNFIIDLCEPCALVWLDHGELARIIRAPGRDHEHWQFDLPAGQVPDE